MITFMLIGVVVVGGGVGPYVNTVNDETFI